MANGGLQEIDMGFSVADAESPEIEFSSGILKVRFSDWQESQKTITFTEVRGVLWQEAEQLLPGEPNDGCVEVIDSDWSELHAKQDGSLSQSALRHVNMNFNAAGKLSVLFEGGVESS